MVLAGMALGSEIARFGPQLQTSCERFRKSAFIQRYCPLLPQRRCYGLHRGLPLLGAGTSDSRLNRRGLPSSRRECGAHRRPSLRRSRMLCSCSFPARGRLPPSRSLSLSPGVSVLWMSSSRLQMRCSLCAYALLFPKVHGAKAEYGDGQAAWAAGCANSSNCGMDRNEQRWAQDSR